MRKATKNTNPITKGGIKLDARYLVVTFNIDCASLARIQFFKHQKNIGSNDENQFKLCAKSNYD